MKMKTLRKLREQQAKVIRRRSVRSFDVSDATMEADTGPAPEAVFDRITGPYGRRYTSAFCNALDEET
jgi:hypothetical protein